MYDGSISLFVIIIHKYVICKNYLNYFHCLQLRIEKSIFWILKCSVNEPILYHKSNILRIFVILFSWIAAVFRLYIKLWGLYHPAKAHRTGNVRNGGVAVCYQLGITLQTYLPVPLSNTPPNSLPAANKVPRAPLPNASKTPRYKLRGVYTPLTAIP